MNFFPAYTQFSNVAASRAVGDHGLVETRYSSFVLHCS